VADVSSAQGATREPIGKDSYPGGVLSLPQIPARWEPWVERAFVLLSIVFGIVGPLACFVENSRQEVFVDEGGFLYGAAACLLTLLALVLFARPTQDVLHTVACGAFAMGVLVALAFTPMLVPLGAMFFFEGIGELDLEQIHMGLLGLMPLATACVFGFHAWRSGRRARAPGSGGSWLFVLGLALPLAGGAAGHGASRGIDRYCTRIIVEEGEAGSAKLAIWKPISSILPLDGVRVAYRDEMSVNGQSPRARSMSRAYGEFVGTRYLR
jgi:hypothetical protein